MKEPARHLGPASTRRVDADSPWLGLAPFTEETQSFFFGRDAELREIFLRVRDHTLTVLYGQSGLGKSSLIGAGLIPKLRVEGYRPALVRLRFEEQDPPIVEQARIALANACGRSETPAAALLERWQGFTLWECFHHPELRPASLDTAPPVLIFDQFEEVFTLGAAPQSRIEVARFATELADLAENRPPESIRQRLNEDLNLGGILDFGLSPLRLVLTLREDYLAGLEAWKAALPSLMRNRMVLKLLSGPQAMEAVVRPGRLEGRCLVTDEVATQIVYVIANRPPGIGITEIEAVPPLLSLLCDELNQASSDGCIRREQVQEQSGEILQSFYRRCFEGHPMELRHFVEDRLVTVNGHRNQVARDDAEAELARHGLASPGEALESLVVSRLLRAEQVAGVQRLEIMHDVLTELVVRSRRARQRQEQVARIEAEREAAEARAAAIARERSRLRRLAIAMTVLALSAIAGLVAALVLSSRARRAEQAARTTGTELQAAILQQQGMLADAYLNSDRAAREARKYGDAAIWLNAAIEVERKTPRDPSQNELALRTLLHRAPTQIWGTDPADDFHELFGTADGQGVVAQIKDGPVLLGRLDSGGSWRFERTLQDLGSSCQTFLPISNQFVGIWNGRLHWVASDLNTHNPALPPSDPDVESGLDVNPDQGSVWCVNGTTLRQVSPAAGLLREIPLRISGELKIWQLVVDLARNRAATRATLNGRRRLLVIDLTTGLPILDLPRKSGSSRFAGRDGWVLLGSASGEQGAELLGVPLDTPDKYWKYVLPCGIEQVVSEDDISAEFACSDGRLRRWSWTGEFLETRDLPAVGRRPFRRHRIAHQSWWTIDSRTFVSGTEIPGGWEAEDGVVQAGAAAVVDSGNYLVTNGGHVQLRSLNNNALLRTFEWNADDLQPDQVDSRLYVRDGNRLRCHDSVTYAAEGSVEGVFPNPITVLSGGAGVLAWESGGLRHFAARSLRRQGIWRVNTNTVIVADVNGTALLLEPNVSQGSYSLIMIDTARAVRIEESPIPLDPSDVAALKCLTTENGRRLLVARINGAVELWNLDPHPDREIEKPESLIPPGAERIQSFWDIPDGRIFAAGADGRLDLFRMGTDGRYATEASLRPFRGHTVSRVLPADDSSWLLLSTTGECAVWRIAENSIFHRAKVASAAGSTCCHSENLFVHPSGPTVIATRADGSSHVLHTGKATSGDISRVCLNPSRTWLAAVCTDKSTFLWKVVGDRVVEAPLAAIPSHNSLLTFLDDRTILTGSGRVLLVLRVADDGTTAIAWQRDLPEEIGVKVRYGVQVGDDIVVGDETSAILAVLRKDGTGDVRTVHLPEAVRCLASTGIAHGELIAGGTGRFFILESPGYRMVSAVSIPDPSGKIYPYYVRSVSALDERVLAVGTNNRILLYGSGATSPFFEAPVEGYVWGLSFNQATKRLHWHGDSVFGSLSLPDFGAPVPDGRAVENFVRRRIGHNGKLEDTYQKRIRPPQLSREGSP